LTGQTSFQSLKTYAVGISVKKYRLNSGAAIV